MRRALLYVALLSACDDELDQRLAIIDAPRVLAVISTPAEAKPGAQISYQAVLASPDGPLATVPAWAFCTAPKPPTEDNVASVDCIAGEGVIDLGTGARATGMLPADGCLRFGPDTPPGGFRPRSPDETGGYYQPVRVVADDLLAIGLTRITCKLPTAPTEIARAYDLAYVANTNPTLEPLVLTTVPADTDVTLTASWPASAVETYLHFDPVSQTLVDRREAMRVSWFATGGALDVDASLVDEQDVATSASTTWHTPSPGTAWLWLVLRDSRGGVAAQALAITVE
ncbi:MAG: hypothetical protein SFX73_01225 [Kofleriaceae bacterium]|nr:hypothetical protein [Kofleriaceae bacterium]